MVFTVINSHQTPSKNRSFGLRIGLDGEPLSFANVCVCVNFEPFSEFLIWICRFQLYGGAVPYRPVEDIAFAVARFFQRGGTLQNYYMVIHPSIHKWSLSSILCDTSR